MSLAKLTDKQLTKKIAAELKRLSKATAKQTNQYGDLRCCPAGCKLVYGRHNRGVKRQELTGWRRGMPEKCVVHVTSDLFEQLVDQRDSLRSAAAKSAKKFAELSAAHAGGHKSIAAFKRFEKARVAFDKFEAFAKAKAAANLKHLTDVARLLALGLDEDDTSFIGVLGVLEEASVGGFEVKREHARAARYAKENDSSAWQAYCEGELSASELLHRCERAQHRHEATGYDDYLRQGVDREEAREMARYE